MTNGHLTRLGVHDDLLDKQANNLSPFFETQVREIGLHALSEICELFEQL